MRGRSSKNRSSVSKRTIARRTGLTVAAALGLVVLYGALIEPRLLLEERRFVGGAGELRRGVGLHQVVGAAAVAAVEHDRAALVQELHAQVPAER